MKKTVIRAILLLLAFSLAFPCFSCASNPNDETDTTAADVSNAIEETTAASPPPMAKQNYNCNFTVLYCEDTFRDIDNFFSEAEIGSPVPDSTYERSLYVKDHLGVNLKTDDGGNWLEYFPKLKSSIKAGDDAYQMVMTHPHGSIADMIKSGYILDYNDIPGINLNNSYWNKSLMEELAVGDACYLGYGDLSLACCYLVAFNKQMYANHGFDDPYALVDNREWTLDKFLSTVSAISIDLTGDGKTPNDDTFGLSGWGWVPIVSFMSACNIKVAEKDADGEVYISLDSNYGEKFADIVDTFKALFKSESAFLYPVGYTGDAPEIDSDRVLFSIISNPSLVYYAGSTVKIGVLPYPLYNSAQKEYRSLSWNGYLAIPSSVLNLQMVGDTMELLMYLSEPVKTAYFEVLLGARLADATEDAHMLDVIWNSQISDIGLAYCSTSTQLETLFYILPRLGDSNDNYASFYKKYGKASDKKLKSLFQN